MKTFREFLLEDKKKKKDKRNWLSWKSSFAEMRDAKGKREKEEIKGRRS